MNLLYFIATGILLLLIMRYGAHATEAVFARMPFRKELVKGFSMFGVIVWVAYVFWGSYIFFGDTRYYEMLVLIMAVLLVIGVAWFFFRDYLAGIMIRSDFDMKVGQYIKTPDAEGFVVKLGNRFVEMKNDRGELIRLPFCQLSRQWITLRADAEKTLTNHLVIRLPDDVDAIRLKAFVEAEMMGMPWIIGTPPALKVKKNEQDQLILELRYELLKEEHNLLVENKIRKIISDYQDA